MYLTLTTGKRLALLLCTFLVCFFIVSVLSVLITHISDGTRAMRMVTIIQDLVAFVVPPVVTALMVTRCPATLLAVDRKPRLAMTLVAIAVVIVSIPAMNWVIWANRNVPFPAEVAQFLGQLEQQSDAMVQKVMGAHTPGDLLMSILIIGVLAGLSEELLFRGGLQRLLVTGGVNRHVAVWTTAAVFSMMHLQFYGFVPRLLLGAFFGYALVWSGSLWLPILLHALNNIHFLLAVYFSGGHDSVFETLGAGNSYGVVAASVVVTAAALTLMALMARRTTMNLGLKPEAR